MSEHFSAIRGVPGATLLDNAVLSSAGEHHVVRYIEATAAHLRVRKQNATFSGRAFYPSSFLLVLELRNIQSTACQKHPLSFDKCLLIEILQTSTFVLPLMKLQLHTVSLLPKTVLTK